MTKEGEAEHGDFFNISKMVYLKYSHLSKVIVQKDQLVYPGQIIGYTGFSGNAKGTRAPHLHFEISNKYGKYGGGLKYRTNPAFFVNYLTDNEAVQQQTVNDLK